MNKNVKIAEVTLVNNIPTVSGTFDLGTGLMAGLWLMCAFTTGTSIPALSGGSFAATLLTSE